MWYHSRETPIARSSVDSEPEKLNNASLAKQLQEAFPTLDADGFSGAMKIK